MSKTAYISLPISGHDINRVRDKIDLIKLTLSKKGYRPVSPLEVNAGKNPQYEDHICCDLRAMLDCDAVCFCDGWEASLGCNIEHDVVMRYKAHGKKNFKVLYE